MQEIFNFENLEYSNRHGMYGGAAGDKDGVLINDEYWIIKYPRNTKSMNLSSNLPSYTTAPLSEYIGSHIYNILGIPVHETLLGVRNNKLVVACKDFCKTRGELLEVRTLKNAANKELSEKLESELYTSCTGDSVNLNELLLHLKENHLLCNVNDLTERFWDSVVIDVLIDNNDRNNGNWGLLYNETTKKYSIAPVYDNGNSFENKITEDKIKDLLNNPQKLTERALGSRTAYTWNGKLMSAKKILTIDNADLKQAILRVIPKIQEKTNDIITFINNIPESVTISSGANNKELYVCSPERKKLYIQNLLEREKGILYPAYEQIQCMCRESNSNIDELNINIEDDFGDR